MPDQISTSEKEVNKYFAFNETGNIMVSSTVANEIDLREEVVTEFQKVSVLFDAVATALTRSGKDINDYEALNKLLGGSEWCEQVHTECRTLSVKADSIAVNLALITDIIGDVSATGGAMMVAKSVLSSIAGKMQAITDKNGMFTVSFDSQKIGDRVAHILFVCEDLMGMPLISIQCIHAKKDQDSFKVAVGRCGSATKQDLDIFYQVDTYIFVDPQYIHQFTPEFRQDPQFEKLIGSFQDVIAGKSQQSGLPADDNGKNNSPSTPPKIKVK